MKYPTPNKTENPTHLKLFYHVLHNYVHEINLIYLPQVSAVPSLFCVHMEGVPCGTKPGLWNKTSGPGASPQPLAGPETAGSVPVKSCTHTNMPVLVALFGVMLAGNKR